MPEVVKPDEPTISELIAPFAALVVIVGAAPAQSQRAAADGVRLVLENHAARGYS